MTDLRSLQARIVSTRAQRGFTTDAAQLVVLLTEELGEVAAEVKRVWSANYRSFEPARLADELADVLVLVSALAAGFDIDLTDAVERKFFTDDAQRTWATARQPDPNSHPLPPVAALRQSHAAQRLVTNDVPTLDVPGDVKELRCALIEEEAAELRQALDADDLVEVADAIGDLLYVVYGAALTFGIPADEVFAEVHRSNMTKLDDDGEPVIRDDGKVMKGPNFSPPDLLPILIRNGYEPDGQ